MLIEVIFFCDTFFYFIEFKLTVERVERLKFLGVHITNKLSWSKHTKTVVKRNIFPLGRLK